MVVDRTEPHTNCYNNFCRQNPQLRFLFLLVSSRTNKKCVIFKDIFPGLSSTLSFNFQDFPGPKCFSRTFQVLEFSRKNPGLSRRSGNPVSSHKKRCTAVVHVLQTDTRISYNNCLTTACNVIRMSQ